MEVILTKLGRRETIESRDTAVIDNRLLSHSDIGIYFRIKRALDSGDGIEFYIDDRDPDVLAAVNRLAELGYLEVISS